MTKADGNSHNEKWVSTGLAGLDDLLDRLRIGDNIVWRVSDLDDYRRFVNPFIQSAASAGRRIIYLRFGQHPPLVPAGQANIHIESIDALGGFEAFTGRVWRLIEEHGRPGRVLCLRLPERSAQCLGNRCHGWQLFSGSLPLSL
ncbi:MAG: hypothetical protein ACTHWH_15475 [Marinobacter sp.]